MDLPEKYLAEEFFEISTEKNKSSQNMPKFFVKLFFKVIYPKITDESRRQELQKLYFRLKENNFKKANMKDI